MAENTVASEVAAGEGIYLAAAAKLFPSHREGRAVSGSCVFRWCTDGVKLSDGRRVFLEHVRLAGRILTTRGAIRRFLEAQTSLAADAASEVRTPTRRRRQHLQAAAALQANYGI
jgi:Protein of unknown function (DUF1580)